MNYKRNSIPLIFFSILTIIFSVYTSTIMYANAVSVVTVTFPAGTTTHDVSYRTGLGSSDTDTTAYIIGANAGVVKVWKKNSPLNTIGSNVTLTGSVSARAIENNPDTASVFAVTNDKFYRLTSNIVINAQFASGTANIVRSLVYDDSTNTMYYCTNDGYGELNTVTLSPTALYNDPQTNTVLGCAVDEENQFMYLSGSDMGASFTCEVLKISLSTHTEVDCANTSGGGDVAQFSVCYDSSHNQIWTASSSNSRVQNFDSDLNLIISIATGTVPRNCSISNSEGANRAYFNIEGTDSVTIIDTEADAIISTHVVCNLGATAPKMDTKRLFNTTNTYVTCPEATNSIVIDDTVSEEIPPDIVNGVDCSLPQFNGLLMCEPEQPLAGASELIGNSTFDLLVQIGFIDGSDTDCKTNGVGYTMVIVGLGILVGLMWVASRGNMDIPNFVWMVGMLAIIGLITIMGCLDPTFFILTIIVIVALASVKARNLFGGTGLFQGESY